ncbi:MAG: class I SAM-dependent methyltransferase [Stellaceae bacterium]
MNSQLSCHACGAGGQFYKHCAREMQFGSMEAFWYLECVKCGTLQIETAPSDLARQYPPDYLVSNCSNEQVSENSFKGLLRHFVRQQRTGYLLNGWSPIGWAANKIRPDDLTPQLLALRPIGAQKKARILDVGCGPGYLLRRLCQNGYDQLTGQDPFQKWTVPGIRVYDGGLEDLPGQFDLVMLHHSLEHTPDPLQILINLKRLLAPNGTLLVRIPLAASEAWTQYGVNWYQIDAPRHLVIPSVQGMNTLAQRAMLEIYRVKFDSNETQFLCSEQYRRGIPLRDMRSYYRNPYQTLFTRSEIADAKTRSRKVNRRGRGDQACFYLRDFS